MSLWDDLKDAAETVYNAGRYQVAVAEDAWNAHVLDDKSYAHTTTLAQSLGLPTEDVAENVELTLTETPGVSVVRDTWDKLKEELPDVLPPGPWWLWALVGVGVLGVGVVVTVRVLR